ncbi:MAG: Uma2 family endonuclease [Planctomycetaceae bacterium]|nr:Uma2 family endonuclease [Planctomycetaceae bacterium]
MNSNRIVTPTKIKGVPELVVEMLSPSTRERDQQLKRELYEQNRVPEYWTVDADNQLLSCYRLSREGAYAQPTQHSDEISIALGNVTARIDLRKVW